MALANNAIPVEIVALADREKSSLQQATRTLKGRFPAQFNVTQFHVGSNERFCSTDFGQSGNPLAQVDLDIVFVATPVEYRASHTASLLHAGKHVYTEHPLAVTDEQLGPLVRPACSISDLKSVLSLGCRSQLSHQFDLDAIAGEVGAIREIRLRETIESSTFESILRSRIEHFEFARSLWAASTCQFGQSPQTELIDTSVSRRSSSARIRIDGLQLLSSVVLANENKQQGTAHTKNSRDSRIFEVLGTRGTCDLNRGRCSQIGSEKQVRIRPQLANKTARSHHILELLHYVHRLSSSRLPTEFTPQAGALTTQLLLSSCDTPMLTATKT